MSFSEFVNLFQSHTTTMFKNTKTLFKTDIGKDTLWETYLESFPEGTNQIFKKKREYDCNCCKQFIRSFGNVVTIKDNKLVSIWDFDAKSSTYQPVINALSLIVKKNIIADIFITKISKIGTASTHTQLDNGEVITWNHFSIDLPKKFIEESSKTKASIMSEYRSNKEVFKRSLEEISENAIKIVLELIAQKSLYKGDEWKTPLTQFYTIYKEHHNLQETEKDIYCWNKSIETSKAITKIRNHSIGVLLNDITKEVELNKSVQKYESIVAPSNYKRPKTIFTKKMIEQAQQSITDLGLLESLGRRYATIDDITINNIIFANKDASKKMGVDIFSELKQEVSINSKQFDKIEQIPIEQFVENILPTATTVEMFFENQHVPNLVSVIAPKIKTSKTLFKWDNSFSWGYNGNMTDSMKERVKSAGGNVDGVLRFSIQWNENNSNNSDFDAHCIEPNSNHIYYHNKGVHISTGRLDVDIIHPKRNKVAVENITWIDINKMQEGGYHFYVHNFSKRRGTSGFSAEIEYNGQIYSYEYNKELRQGEKVTVALLKFNKNNGIQFIKSLSSTTSSKTIWGIQTNQFHPVSICMFSPNYWDKQMGTGNKHYFFISDQCKNDDTPNGFFNEFLREEFISHKRVFEALGSKMKVESSDQQLSGLGFSSTQRNSLICKVSGNFNRTVKVIF